MAASLDRFKVTIEGSTSPTFTGATSVQVWFQGLTPEPKPDSDQIDYLGGTRRDDTVWMLGIRLRSIPFSYKAGSAGGIDSHDFTTWWAFLQVLEMPYRRITAVTGTDRIGSDGVTQFWAEHLPIEVGMDGYSQRDEDDDHVRVEVSFYRVTPGL